MIELEGKYNTAKVFTDNIEETAVSQIIELCNQEFTEGSKIRIMPDTHAGAGCTIGTTMTITDKIVPNLVGVDIGCGMETIIIKERDIDLKKLDKVINDFIPSGFDIRDKEHQYVSDLDFNELVCKSNINMSRARLSIGTLGGGNHFIEVAKDEEDNIYIVVHSGSRHLGKQVAEHYQRQAYLALTDITALNMILIQKLRESGREGEIHAELAKLKKPKVSKQLAYVEGKNFDDYINDMKFTQQYAMYNRKAIADEIISKMGLTIFNQFSTIHNYIDTSTMILRKGAISAQDGELMLIPINMRDGSLLCVGKGNADWNYSAPHGAGRIMSRTKAKENISLEEFKDSMEGIYTTSVDESTIDEAPMAYKPMEEIMGNIKDTVDIINVVKPIYNFKSN